jgi:protein gp37
MPTAAPQYHKPFSTIQTIATRLDQPIRWRRPRRIFVNSLSDLFHDAIGLDFIRAVFGVMALCPQHTFQILTKRPERMRNWILGHLHPYATRYCVDIARRLGLSLPLDQTGAGVPWPLRNVWLGVSVEDQQRADERIPLLLDTPAAIRFLSCEPLLGPINADHWIWRRLAYDDWPAAAFEPGASECVTPARHLHWVIVGGESGPHARPMHPDWARSLRDQCQASRVPFLFKQWGEWVPDGLDLTIDSTTPFKVVDGVLLTRVGKRTAGRLLDGRTWDEFPIELPAAVPA